MNTKNIQLPNEILIALDILESKGFEAYLVGGAVRDFVMNNNVSDYDITTNATPQEIHNLFEKCIDTGIAHGTVTVIINSIHIEITTFRHDGEYLDHRRPDTVHFSHSLIDDLSRRDFTANALAYNPKCGIIDLYGGICDIEKMILRCVGEPEKRFDEDALRMLRLIRFSAKLGFDVDTDTLNALIKKQSLITYVSKERIRDEILKTLLSQHTEKILLFNKSTILDYIFGCNFFEGIEEKEITNLKLLPLNYLVRLAYIIHILYKDDIEKTKGFLTALKFSNKEKNLIISIISFVRGYLDNPDSYNNPISIKKSMSVYPEEAIYTSFDILSLYGNIKDVKAIFLGIKDTKEPYLTKHLNIDGKELISMGYSGCHTGKCLKHLLDIVIENPHKNTKEFLIKEAKIYHAHKCLCKNKPVIGCNREKK